YIYGSHVFCLYDWGGPGLSEGLLGPVGERRAGYYALRMGIRVLQGGRSTFFPVTNSANLTAVATLDPGNSIYLLVANSQPQSYTVNADISALITAGKGTVREFSAKAMDRSTGSLNLNAGKMTFTVAGNSAVAIEFKFRN
ncbi:MAG: hypothetical protein ACRC62_03430, partial [Microcoleus sp.]